jgi:hypothetical protein
MEPLWFLLKNPRPTPWGRIVVTLSGTGMLVTLACRDDWHAGSIMGLWALLILLVWGTAKV